MVLNYYMSNRFSHKSIEYKECRCIFFWLAKPIEIFFFLGFSQPIRKYKI